MPTPLLCFTGPQTYHNLAFTLARETPAILYYCNRSDAHMYGDGSNEKKVLSTLHITCIMTWLDYLLTYAHLPHLIVLILPHTQVM